MKKKAFFAYGTLLVTVFLSHAFPFRAFTYAIPLFLTAVPIFLRERINFSFSMRHIILGAWVSLVVLAPVFIWLYTEKSLRPLSLHMAMTQLFLVSFPEEVFFRGFLQDILGNNVMGVVIVSLMFSLSHLPLLLFGWAVYAPLTFFPSLVMGLLYMKTSNVLPSAIFHFLANVVFLGFMI
jgi:membrane protease YdiL (CAAX protease family)